MMKSAFCFLLKALFVLEIFTFLSRLFSNSKFMASQPGKQTFAIHILPNISRSKSNQAIKFRQLIDNNVRNIFLQKSSKKKMKHGDYFQTSFQYIIYLLIYFLFIYLFFPVWLHFLSHLLKSCIAVVI